MSSKSRALVFALFAAAAVSTPSHAATADRVIGDLTTSQKVALHGNVHGLARPEFDLGRADGGRVIQGVALSFRPSPAQQQDLDSFLAQLADPHSESFHQYLTPAEFGTRFGMSQNDIAKISAWLEAQGFTNISVANGRNMISFDGTISQVESVFAVEMHNYLIDGVVHLANAGEPSVPMPLAGLVMFVHHLNDFSPRPRVKVKSNLTSYVTGNHFLTPGDFAVIYDLGTLYTAGGTGQKIAVVGQSTVNTTDLSNFRSAAGLPASTVTMTLVGGTGTRCPGDEGESDLDLEWSGGVAQNASVTFVYAGLGVGDTCTSRTNDVWNALEYAIDNNVAPFVSTSYGYCESPTVGITLAQAQTFQSWIVQGQTQGQTVTAASGDSGAADCDTGNSATLGLAVDVPASIPQVTGAGGNEFTGDSSQCPSTGCTTNTAPADLPYWAASNAGSDAVVTALEYITEEAWNDTSESLAENPPAGLSASGGGASQYFSKPSWQTGTGVPTGGNRDVPDISVTTSQFHDPYLICSEDSGTTALQSSCATGFRDSSGYYTAVGGTSAAAPTFTAVLALINQFVGNGGTTGLAPINPTLYSLAASTPSAFHDVTTGNNLVPCTTGTPSCPSTTSTECNTLYGGPCIGFSAGVGYDQVTGLGSPDVTKLANAWNSVLVTFDVAASALTPSTIPAGGSATSTVTVSPQNGFSGTVGFYCSGQPSGATCTFNPTTVSNASGTTQLTIQTASTTPGGNASVEVVGTSGLMSRPTGTSLSLTVIAPSFTMGAGALNPTSVSAGASTTSTITITPQNGFLGPVNLACSGLPTGATCSFNPSQVTVTSTSSVSSQMTIQTSGNMSPSTTQVTVNGSGSTTGSTTVSLQVTASTMSFSLSTNLSGGTVSVAQGQSAGPINIVVGSTSTPSFLIASGSGNSTALPLTYTCTGLPSAASFSFTPSTPTSSTTVTLTLATTAPTSRLQPPFERADRIFYAVFLPGLLGIVLTVTSRKQSMGAARMLALILALGLSTLWMASCTGTNGGGNQNTGTPPGSYSITVNATTGGAAPLTNAVTFTLNVTQ